MPLTRIQYLRKVPGFPSAGHIHAQLMVMQTKLVFSTCTRLYKAVFMLKVVLSNQLYLSVNLIVCDQNLRNSYIIWTGDLDRFMTPVDGFCTSKKNWTVRGGKHSYEVDSQKRVREHSDLLNGWPCGWYFTFNCLRLFISGKQELVNLSMCLSPHCIYTLAEHCNYGMLHNETVRGRMLLGSEIPLSQRKYMMYRSLES